MVIQIRNNLIKILSNVRSFNPTLILFGTLLVFSVHASSNPIDANELPIQNPTDPITFGSGVIEKTGSEMIVKQSTDKMIVEWNSFNIGSNASVHFSQPSATSAVLNRIASSQAPSEIYGNLTANGQIYLINPNGILFGSGAVVDVNSLVASSLHLDDALFKSGIFSKTDGSLSFSGSTGSLEVSSDANITARSGGKILFFSPTINNHGVIKAINGQVLLAAGEKVYLSVSQNPNMRGILVELDIGGATNNFGEIESFLGNITLAGSLVNQSGHLKATSSVLANGSIKLQARDTTISREDSNINQTLRYPTRGGVVNLNQSSLTEVLPEIADTTTVMKNIEVIKSFVDISASSIILEGNSSIFAPGGEVRLVAGIDPSNSSINSSGYAIANSSRVYLDGSSVIDVSGIGSSSATHFWAGNVPYKLSADKNIVLAELRGNELKDSPLQRNGILYTSKVYVDSSKAGSDGSIGTSIADVSGYTSQISQTVAERFTNGGDVIIQSEGDVVFKSGAVINLTGGSVEYVGGFVKTTKLISSNGLVYDIAEAPEDLNYIEILNVQQYRPGYKEVMDAGSVSFSAPAMLLKGSLIAPAVLENYQSNPSNLPKGASLQIGQRETLDGSILQKTNVLHSDISFEASAIDDTEPTFNQALTPNQISTLQLGPNFTSSKGFTSLSYYTDGQITVANGANLKTEDRGSILLNGGGLKIMGSLISHGGSVSLIAKEVEGYTQIRNPAIFSNSITRDVELGSLGNIDVSGRWFNFMLEQSESGLVSVDGGSIKISASAYPGLNGGNILLGDSSLLNASGGAWLTSGNRLHSGIGGEITIKAGLGYGDSSNHNGKLILDGVIRADSLSKGGALILSSGSVSIGTKKLGLNGELLLNPTFFSEGGFTSFNISSYEGLYIEDKTTISPTSLTRVLSRGYETKVSGSDITAFSSLQLIDAFGGLYNSRNKTNLSLSATSESFGVLEIGNDAEIIMDPASTLNLLATKQLIILGSIFAPSANVSITLGSNPVSSDLITYSDKQTLWLGSNSQIDVSGIPNIYLGLNGLKLGDVLDAGNISINALKGYVVAENGATLKLNGAHALLDIKSGNSYLTKDVFSQGGSLLVSAREGVFWDATMIAKKGGGDVKAGSFTLNINKEPTSLADGYPVGPRSIIVSGNPRSVPEQLNPGQAINIENNGLAFLSGISLLNAEFDSLKFESRDNIKFLENTSLNILGEIKLDAPNIIVSDGVVASLSSAYLAIGNFQSMYQDNSYVMNPSVGTGSLIAEAGHIDFYGIQSLAGVSKASFNSLGDIQFNGVLPNDKLKLTPIGQLITSGDLEFNANKIYPSTLSEYTVKTIGIGSTVTFKNKGQEDGVPFSVMGSLNVQAYNINQAGVLRAPFGFINLNAENQLILSPGSITSVSSEGKTLPFGETANRSDWLFDFGDRSKKIAILPDKTINLIGNSVKVEKASNGLAAAKVDISGGGDLLAWEFTIGNGGSKDVLDDNGVFAVLPGFTNGYLPGNSQSYNYGELNPGDIVYLSGGNGLAAGNYVLLPAHFALLAGAYSVKSISGAQDMIAQQNIRNADGSMLVSGYKMQYGGLVADSRNSGFLVSSGAIARTQSEFTTELASDFFRKAYSDASMVGYRLPADAGKLAISAVSNLVLDGNLAMMAANNARGGSVDISAPKIAISGNATNAGLGYLTLSSEVLNAMRAESLLIGGLRSNSKLIANPDFSSGGLKSTKTVNLSSVDGILVGQFVSGKAIPDKTYVSSINESAKSVTLTNDFTEQTSGVISFYTSPPGFEYFDVKASDVELIGNAQLSGQEIILAATNKVATEFGTAVSGNGIASTNTNAILVGSSKSGSGDGALLRVSSGAQRDLIRTSLVKSTGALDLQGSITTAKSVILDATNSNTLTGIVGMASGGSLTVGAPKISFGETNESVGLLFNSSRLSNLESPSALLLNSYSTLDFYGTVTLGNANLDRLSIKGAGINGYDNATKIVTLTAKTVDFGNAGELSFSSPGSTGTGTIIVNAKEIISGSNNFKTNGFSEVTFNADQFTGQGIGGLDVSGNLKLHANRITTARLADQKVKVSGVLQTAVPTDLTFDGANPSLLAAALGGKLSLEANMISHVGNIEMPSGQVTLKATGANDSLIISEGSTLSAKGSAQMLGQIAVLVDGGKINLQSTNGNLIVEDMAVVDVSATGGAAAGSLIVTSRGTANVLGIFKGGADAGNNVTNPTQGSFEFYASMFLDDNSLSSLNAALETGKFNESRKIQVTEGDLTLANTVTAHKFTLTTDDGNINLISQINASGAKGGIVNINAGQKVGSGKGNINLASDAKISVSATIASTESAGSIGDGGKVILSTSTDGNASPVSGSRITLATDSVINLSKGLDSIGNGVGSDGTLVLRAPRTNISGPGDSGTGLNLTASITGNNVKGGNATILIEGVKVYNTTGNLSLNSTYASTLNANNTSFLTNAISIQEALGTISDERVMVIAGDEVRSTGIVTVNNDINLQTWAPGALTIRAASDINVNGSISAGFTSASSTGNTAGSLTSGGKWTYRMVAGSDLHSADVMTTNNNLIGNFTLGAGKIMRTGTGDIEIATGGNFTLSSATSVIYTAGELDKTDFSNLIFNKSEVKFAGQQIFPVNGGNISIISKNDINGSHNTQLPSNWLFRQGKIESSNGQYSTNTAWWPFFGSREGAGFQKNIGALAGGDVNITAEGYIKDLSAAIVTNGRVFGIDSASSTLVVNGGGDLIVKAGQDLSGGIYMVDHGTAFIRAGGAIKVNASGFETAIALGQGKVDIQSFNQLNLMTVFNPMITGMSSLNLPSSQNKLQDISYFSTYKNDGQVKLVSVADGVQIGSSISRMRSVHNQLYGVNQNTLRFFPGNLQVAALGSDIIFNQSIVMSPSSSGNLELGSRKSIKFDNSSYLAMSDIDPSVFPSPIIPLNSSVFANTMLINGFNGKQYHSEKLLHSADISPVLVYAEEDIIGAVNSETMVLPKFSSIWAGRDILNFTLLAQNLNVTDTTNIIAGRDIINTSSISSSGSDYLINSSRIFLNGPGNLNLAAGRNINLGNSFGIISRGNLENPFLNDAGASITVLVGANIVELTNLNVNLSLEKYLSPTDSVYMDKMRTFVELQSGFIKTEVKPKLTDSEVILRFNRLSSTQKYQLMQTIFFDELKISGIEHNDSASNRYGSYQRGMDAITTLFPNENYGGNLNLSFSQIKTERGGDINVFAPGGGIVVGLVKTPGSMIAAKNDSSTEYDDSPSRLGLVTVKGGGINIFTRNSVEVARSRVLTAGGGDVLIWSSIGDIDAGKGAKTATSSPPPLIRTDSNGNTIVDIAGVVTGSGIGTLQTLKDAPLANVYLIAPSGTVDAGDAGVRSSGNLLVAAQAVANGANMQAGGTSSGVPAPSTANVSFSAPVSTDSSNSSKQADKATEAASKSANKTASALPSLITVEVLSLGDEASITSDSEKDEKKKAKKQQN